MKIIDVISMLYVEDDTSIEKELVLYKALGYEVKKTEKEKSDDDSGKINMAWLEMEKKHPLMLQSFKSRSEEFPEVVEHLKKTGHAAITYFWVDSLNDLVELEKKKEIKFLVGPRETPYMMREIHVLDVAGKHVLAYGEATGEAKPKEESPAKKAKVEGEDDETPE